jgi:hypothetical protein
VTQDGEDEGCLKLSALPTPEQAIAIRKALGIQKCKEVSAETLARLRNIGFSALPEPLEVIQ